MKPHPPKLTRDRNVKVRAEKLARLQLLGKTPRVVSQRVPRRFARNDQSTEKGTRP